MKNNRFNIARIECWLSTGFVFALLLSGLEAFPQFQCGSGTPTFQVNLTTNPNAVWQSPDTNRIDTCCGASAPDKCVGFEVTLHPQAEGIIFSICDGAIPPGAIFYQVNCGDPTPVGEALCLTGVGPHYITFCKPGNNSNIYCIQSIAEPTPGPSVAVNDGCSGQLYVEGFDPDSIQWTSIAPGPVGAYDTLLDCTSGCDTVNIIGGNNLPDSVEFQACGPLLGDCDTAYYCVTMKAYFFNTLQAVISPEEPAVCFGSPGTWIYASGNGGSPPYTFNWSTGSTQDSIYVGVGTYILEVGDTSGCPPAYDTVYVDSFSLPIVAMAGSDTGYCNSFWPVQLQGNVQSATGGVWIGGDGTFSPDSFTLNATYEPGPIDSTNGGVELILITTGNMSCPPDTDSVSISLHTYETAVSVTPKDPSCFGFSDGSAEVQYLSGPPITIYEWQTTPLQYGDSITGLSEGTYTVIITDSLGCDTTINVVITDPPELILSNSNETDATCAGYQDGVATVGANGGTPPYNYQWSNGTTTAVNDSLPAGSYTVTVTDAKGCLDSLSFLIEEPPGITINLNALDVECFGDNTGAANAFPVGPYSNYQYQWSSGSTNAIANGLGAGMHTVTITYGNNCLDSDSITVNQPDSIEITLSDTNISCFGLTDGAIGSMVTGGVQPYQYTWSNTATTQNISGLGAGTYTLVVSDQNDCNNNFSATIIEPADIDIDSIVQHVNCFGDANGSVSTSATGGVQPYVYNWSNNTSGTAISNLTAGTYTLELADFNQCTKTRTYIITQPDPLSLDLNPKHVTCFGGNDGWIKAEVNGGTTTYNYAWTAFAIGDSAFSLLGGTYSVTVTDANGCTITGDTTLTEPDPISIQMSGGETICLNTTAAIFTVANGGNGGYHYLWSDSLPDSDSHVVSPQETTTYVVSVTDSLGCPAATGQVTINVKPIVFGEMSVSSNPNELCAGKSAKITGTYQGDLTNYQLEWTQNLGNQPGTFTVSPEQATLYKMTVIDECGFKKADSVFLQVNPTPVLDFPDVIDEGCAPFLKNFESGIQNIPISTYSWKFGNGLSSSLASPTTTYPNPGEFEVTLEAISNKGCKAEGDGSGTIIVHPSPIANFEIVPDEVTTDAPFISAIDESEGAVNYEWTISDGAVYVGELLEHSFMDWGDYWVELWVENAFGCTDTTVRPVYVEPVLDIKAPTAFTPNTDGSGGGRFDPSATNNDVFYLITEYVSTLHLVIYNRWGEVVFETFDPFEGWDGYHQGELAPMAMYTWRADVVFVDGTELTQTGHVTLLR